MGYTLGTVIALAMVYLAVIVRKYAQATEENQPHIKQLKDRIKKLVDGLDSETKIARAARIRVEDAKISVSDLKMQLSTVERDLAEEKQREQQLEMGNYKKEFKRKS
jgi:uncharacterized protein YoxC